MMNFDRSRRFLFGALAFSLLLHLLALFGWDWPRRQMPVIAAPPLQAVVATRPVPMPRAPAPLPPEAAVPRPPSLPAKARPVVPPVQVAAAVPQPPLPTPSPASVPPAAAGAPADVAKPAAAAAGTEAEATPEAGAAVNADSLRQYRIDLAVAARRFRIYPALARARGWQGVAEVKVSVSSPAPVLHLSRSSGHAVLDEQAVQMLSRAAATTPLPEGLRGRSFEFVMPIRFSLED